MNSSDLLYFADPDEELNAVHYSTKEDFSLELGDEFSDLADDMSDAELEDWARDQGYLDDSGEYDFIDEDGIIDHDRLRDQLRAQEEDYPSNNSYPSGRAFDWLHGLQLKFPEELGISLVDGACPGNDWRGVIAENYDALKKLQDFLAANGFKVNFIIDFS